MGRTKISFVVGLVVCQVGAVMAGTSVWTNGASGTRTWCNAGNWSSGVPGASDTAKIDQTSPEVGPIIDCAVDVGALVTSEGEVRASQGLIMDVNYSGTVSIGGYNIRHLAGTIVVNINGNPDVSIDPGGDKWRFGDSAAVILNIDDNPTIVANGIRGADNDDGTFTLNMTGGTLHLLDELSIGDNGGGEINISGGSLIVDTDIALGDKRGIAPITVNMTGGLIRTGQFQLPSNANRAGVVRVNLYGGVLDCGEFVHGSMVDDLWSGTDEWRLDIEQGTLRIAGDVRDKIDANVAAGQITAYDGEGEVIIALVGPNTVVTALVPDPLTATKPFPTTGSDNVDPNVVVHWTPGITAASHDVYFGTDFNDVNDATTSDTVYQDNIESNEWDPCGVGIALEQATTYYWRVDEVEAGGATTHRGRVWRFTTGTVIIDPNMIAYYRFDETEGSTASDSSGYGRHASIYVRNNQPPRWDPNGYKAQCLAFHNPADANDDAGRGVTSVQPPSGTLSSIDRSVTVAVWLRESWNHQDPGDTAHNWVFNAGTGGEGGLYHMMAAVPLDDEQHVLWRAGNDTNDLLMWDIGGRDPRELEDWHHWAFVKDENAGVMRIYFDGLLQEQKSGTVNTLNPYIKDAPFKIGATTWVNYDYAGYMDEFRVYNRALSDAELFKLIVREPELAWGPDPFDGQTEVPAEVSLIWRPGDYAQVHDVYFATSFDDVNDADTTTSGVYKGRQEANSYNPGSLQMDTTYYWRIDEVNTTDPNLWKGNVWEFTVADYLVLDDFESYHDDLDDLYWFYGGNWLDGIDNGTGSTLLLGIPPDPAHSGDQSLYYYYFNVSGYSEAERVINSGERNWTDVGVKMLTLFFYGDPGNDAGTTEQLYCGIEDGSATYAEVQYGDQPGEDMNDVQKGEWNAWNIALNEFTGVTLTDVQHLFIGFGARGSSTSGGNGVVYFDDIRLYLPTCVPSRIKPEYDLSGNCIVDIADVEIMADAWLASDACLPVSAPTDAPAGWWKLDGNANDSAGTAHGTAEGTFQWITGHIDTGAIEFTGNGGRVLVPDAPQLNPTTAVTAMAWINYSQMSSYSARVVVKGADEGNCETFALQLSGDNATWFVRDTNNVMHGASGDEQIARGDWAHAAGSYDGDKVKCYTNGRLEGEDTVGSFNLLIDANGVGIGNRTDALNRALIGAIDDVRIYNVALSDENIAYIATQGSGYVPLQSDVNIYDAEPAGSKAVNFKDFAELMTAWLEEQLWPQ